MTLNEALDDARNVRHDQVVFELLDRVPPVDRVIELMLKLTLLEILLQARQMLNAHVHLHVRRIYHVVEVINVHLGFLNPSLSDCLDDSVPQCVHHELSAMGQIEAELHVDRELPVDGVDQPKDLSLLDDALLLGVQIMLRLVEYLVNCLPRFLDGIVCCGKHLKEVFPLLELANVLVLEFEQGAHDVVQVEVKALYFHNTVEVWKLVHNVPPLLASE